MVGDWRTPFLTVLRRRKYSYRTEQRCAFWIGRFVRHDKASKLEGLGEEQIKVFLDQP